MMLAITIISFVIILSFLFLTHELGHFWAAKRAGVPVLEFGFGFPPTIIKWKKGETVYSINLIPFGAFVRIQGQEEPKDKSPKSYWHQSVGRRFLIAAGGIISNFFWAWLILTITLWLYLVVPIKNFVIIQDVTKGSPASSIGLKQGDILVKGDGQTFANSQQVAQFTKSHKDQEVNLTVERSGKQFQKQVKLGDNAEAPLGISMGDASSGEKVVFWKAPFVAIQTLGEAVYLTAAYLGKAFISIFTKVKVPFEVGGPVAVYSFVAQFSAMGFLYLLRLAAFLSLGLGFFNLLPLPALDGGRLVFLTLEKVFGKKVVKPEIENAIHSVGFVLLIALSILITYNDIRRIFIP